MRFLRRGCVVAKFWRYFQLNISVFLSDFSCVRLWGPSSLYLGRQISSIRAPLQQLSLISQIIFYSVSNISRFSFFQFGESPLHLIAIPHRGNYPYWYIYKFSYIIHSIAPITFLAIYNLENNNNNNNNICFFFFSRIPIFIKFYSLASRLMNSTHTMLNSFFPLIVHQWIDYGP